MTAVAPRAWVAAVAVALAGCGGGGQGGGPTAARVTPPRAPTAGDALLRYLPAGADLVLEIDLARVRENAVVGGVVKAWLQNSGSGSGPAEAVKEIGTAPLLAAKTVMLASYGIGTEKATTATLVTGVEVPGSVRISDDVVALAPPELIRHVEAAAAGAEPSLASDQAMLALRATAMPERAEGAAVRGAARLSFDARVALAATLDADVAPASLSLWADVADDAALVAVLDGTDGKTPGAGGAHLETALAGVRDRLAAAPAVRAAGLTAALRDARIERRGDRLRVVAVIGPKRLRRAAERATALLQPAAQPDASPSKETVP